MLFGNVKWALDLAKYLLDDLLEIAANLDHVSDGQYRKLWYLCRIFNQYADLVETEDKKFEAFSVLLILSSIPRSFLKYICRGLRGIPSSFRNAQNLGKESFEVYFETVNLIEGSPLRVDVYEKFLLGVDNVIKHTYQSAGLRAPDRAAPERELLITASVPPVLQAAVMTILTKTVSLIRPDVSLLHLCTWDYSWLGVGDDDLSKIFREQNEIDIIKKAVVKIRRSKGTQVQPNRRCVRCCSFSEDTGSPKSLASFRLLVKTVVLRTCVCGGMWAIENSDSLDHDCSLR